MNFMHVRVTPSSQPSIIDVACVFDDSVEVSDPIGYAHYDAIIADPDVTVMLLAAGTGITPMVNIIVRRRRDCAKQGSERAFS